MSRRAIAAVVSRMVAPIAQRLQLIVSRGVVTLINDSLKCQTIQVSLLADEPKSDVERFQDYGFTSVPFKDGNAEALFFSVGGNRSHGIVAVVSDRSRRPLGLNEGDAGLFTDRGLRVYLNRDDDIVHVGAKVAAAFMSRADYTDTRLAKLQAAHDAHTHIMTATVGPSAVLGVNAVTAAPVGPLATVAATKGRVT